MSVRTVLSWATRAVAVLHIFVSDVVELGETYGESMLPTLQVSNDHAIIDKKFKYGRGIQMGDLIVARKPTEPEGWICKRITGMPGDIILIDPSEKSLKNLSLKTGSVGVLSDDIKEVPKDDFLERKTLPNDKYIIVPEGHCWVTGENLSASLDSRTYSVLPMGLIKGKLIYAWYNPLSFNSHYFRAVSNNFVQEAD